MSSITPGKFIAFEGIDGSGKSTLIRMLNQKLSEINIERHSTAEPTDNHIGTILRRILAGDKEGDERTIAALFLADRIDHLTHSKYGIMQYLSAGVNVVSDRYYLSSYAYHVPYVSLDWVIEANSICAAVKRPDMILFIDISVSTSISRVENRKMGLEIFETRERITQVRQNYLDAIERVKGDENIVIINGEQSVQQVFDEVWERCRELFKI